MIKITDLATELWDEVSQDSNISPTFIVLWLTENIGKLNILISKDYSINTNSEITPEIGENEKVILKQIFIVYFYGRKLQSVLSSADSNSVVEVTDAGGTIRMLNKNELAKTYMTLKRTEMEKLNQLVSLYKINNSYPISVDGTDSLDSVPYNGSSDYYRT